MAAFSWKIGILVVSLAGPAFPQERADFIGEWVHANPWADGISRIVITEEGGDALGVHAYGQCSPDECDWGPIIWQFTGPPFVVVYEFGWLTTTLTLCLAGPDYLFVQDDNVFHDGTNRDYVTDNLFYRGGSPPDEAVTLDDFVDTWVNLDPDARETDGLPTVRVTRAIIERVDDALSVHLWGVCQPEDCGEAWGTHLVHLNDGTFSIGEFTFRLFEGRILSLSGGARADSFLRRSSSPDVCRMGEGPLSPVFLRGDCDGDGRVEGLVTDAVFLLNHNFFAGPEAPCLRACDANGDGQVAGQVTDAIYLLTFNFLGGPPPVMPFPGCGDALLETDGTLGCGSPPMSCP